jgi:NAD(P)-dependent dehydrogenase (short-subunit alcohol dehydrogenase family)
VAAQPGDVADAAHRQALHAAVDRAGRLDLLVNNASALGPSPLRALVDVPSAAVERVFAVNVLAPVALIQLSVDRLVESGGCVVDVSSDAAVEAYPGWGAYGAAKAALDHLTRVLAVEEPGVRWYAFDPGDMATDLHQQAAPGEDISDLPSPSSVVPALLALVSSKLPSGRYTAAGLTGLLTGARADAGAAS